MPAWNSGLRTVHRFPSALPDRAVRRSARASSCMNCRRTQSPFRYSRMSGTVAEWGSNTYSTSLYSLTVAMGATSHVRIAHRFEPAVPHVLADHFVGVAELCHLPLVQPQGLCSHELHRAQPVGHQHDCAALPGELRGLLGDVPLECSVAAGQC